MKHIKHINETAPKLLHHLIKGDDQQKILLQISDWYEDNMSIINIEMSKYEAEITYYQNINI